MKRNLNFIEINSTSGRLFLLFVSFLHVAFCLSQHNNNWAFGYHSGIRFGQKLDSITTKISRDSTDIDPAFNSISYSDCKGNLILYGSGVQFWNKDNKLLKNGTFHYSSFQFSTMLIPKPNSGRYLYYFYHRALGGGLCAKSEFLYSIIDLQKDNGNGEVVLKDQLLDSSFGICGSGSNNLTYATHVNGHDIWIIHGATTKQVKSYLLTDTGIQITPVISNNVYSGNYCANWCTPNMSKSLHRNEIHHYSHFKTTHDSKNLIATAIDSHTTKIGCCIMYDFDNSNGKVSNPKSLFKFDDLPAPILPNDDFCVNNIYYVEISSNDSFIYLGGYTRSLKKRFPDEYMSFSDLYQVNRYTKTFTRIKRFSRYSQNQLIGLQIGPDGKIYSLDLSLNSGITNAEFNLISIQNPNSQSNKVKVSTVMTNLSLTEHFPASYQPFYKLYFNSNLENDPCIDSAKFDIHVDKYFREFKVLFGDGDSLVFKPPLSVSYSIKHKYKSPGTYFFEIMGLNPNCDYYTKVGDSLIVKLPPVISTSISQLIKGCDSSIYHRIDSFNNTEKVIYKWDFFPSDTLIYNDSSNSATQTKIIYPSDSVSFHKLILELSNSYCPNKTIINDSFSSELLRPVSLNYKLELPGTAYKDSFLGKPRYASCSPFLFRFSDSTLFLKSAHLFYALDTVQYFSDSSFLLETKVGKYKFILSKTNHDGCQASDTFYINSLPYPVTNLSFTPLQQCFDEQNFQLLFKSDSLYNSIIHWGDGDSVSFNNDSSIKHHYNNPGNYSIHIQSKNQYNCLSRLDTSLVLLKNPDASFTVNQDTQCLKDNYFIANPLDSGLHIWNFGKGDTNIPSSSFKSYGNYILSHILSDSSGCKDTVLFPLKVLESPKSILLVKDSIICQNEQLNIRSGSVYSNVSLLQQYLNAGDGNKLSFVGNDSTILKYTDSGLFYLTLISVTPEACTDTVHQRLNVKAVPKIQFNIFNMCAGDSGLISSNLIQGKKPLSYLWTTSNYTSNSETFKVAFPLEGEYKIELFVKDAFNCTTSDSERIVVYPYPNADFEPIHLNHDENSLRFLMKNHSSLADAYYWNFGNNDTSMQKEVDYTFPDTGMFLIRLIASKNNLCYDTVYSLLPVYNRLEFYFPNAFSPDDNGKNEVFGLLPSQANIVKDITLRVYNRWGELVFTSFDINQPWTAENTQQGVYIYIIEIRDIYNVLHNLKGKVEVIR